MGAVELAGTDVAPTGTDDKGQEGVATTMTATDLLEATNSDEQRAAGTSPTEWSGPRPDGTIVHRSGFGNLDFGASWAGATDVEGDRAAQEQMATNIAEIGGASSSLEVAGPTSLSAEVVACSLTTQCTHPKHEAHNKKHVLDGLLQIKNERPDKGRLLYMF